MDFSDYWSDLIWGIEMPSFDCLEDVYIIRINKGYTSRWIENFFNEKTGFWITETTKYEQNVLRSPDYAKQLNNSP